MGLRRKILALGAGASLFVAAGAARAQDAATCTTTAAAVAAAQDQNKFVQVQSNGNTAQIVIGGEVKAVTVNEAETSATQASGLLSNTKLDAAACANAATQTQTFVAAGQALLDARENALRAALEVQLEALRKRGEALGVRHDIAGSVINAAP